MNEEVDYDSDNTGYDSDNTPPRINMKEIVSMDDCDNPDAETFVIPEGKTMIAKNVFIACDSLQSVTFPQSLRIIQATSFAYCSSLTNLNFPPKLERIGYRAFEKCDSIEELTFPESVKYILSFSFNSCKRLTRLVVPEETHIIGESAFADCINLAHVTIPNFGIMHRNSLLNTSNHITFDVQDMLKINTYNKLEYVLDYLGVSRHATVVINHVLKGESSRIVSSVGSSLK